MAVVNVVDVSSRDPSEEPFWGCNIDLPVPGIQTEPHAFSIIGWVLGRSSPAVAVELVNEGTVLSRVPIDVHRPDIATAFLEIPGAERSGFQTVLDFSEMATEFELLVGAVFEDDGRAEIGVIRGRHSPQSSEVEIVEVSTVPADLSALLWGSHVDLPAHESQSDIYAISVRGWALGRSSPVVAMELVSEKDVLRRIPINAQRPDIAARYPSIPEAENSGFQATVNVLGLTPEGFELSVKAILQDEKRVQIGVIRGRRRSLRSDFRPRLQPLVLTNLGRSGSTWLTQLLGQHPQIITYQPFRYEPRVASYWMEILRTLSEPASYLQSVLVTKAYDEYWWIGDQHSSSLTSLDHDLVMQRWLGRDSVEELVGFCQSRIEEFYKHASAIQDRIEPVYFAERFYGTGRFGTRMMWELYTQAREIFLIRDPRDMLCSMLAFSNKTQITMFGREQAKDDYDFVHQIGSSVKGLFQNWQNRSDKAYLLRYEDLIQCSEETLESVLYYLDLSSDSLTVRRMIEQATEMTPEAQLQHQTSGEPTASIGRWRRDLDPSMQAACQEAFGDVLEAFGYTV